MPKVRALTNLPDGTPKGATGEYSDYEAQMLVALKRGVIVHDDETKPASKVTKKVEKPEKAKDDGKPAKGEYKTRDMKASD